MLRHAFKQIDFSLAEIYEWLDLVLKHNMVLSRWTIWSAAAGSVKQREASKHFTGGDDLEGLCKVEYPIKKQELFFSLPKEILVVFLKL